MAVLRWKRSRQSFAVANDRGNLPWPIGRPRQGGAQPNAVGSEDNELARGGVYDPGRDASIS